MKLSATILLVGAVWLPGVTEAADLLCRTPLEIHVFGERRHVEMAYQTPPKAGKSGQFLSQGECAYETAPAGKKSMVLLSFYPDTFAKVFNPNGPLTDLDRIGRVTFQNRTNINWLVDADILLKAVLERDLVMRFRPEARAGYYPEPIVEFWVTRWNPPPSDLMRVIQPKEKLFDLKAK